MNLISPSNRQTGERAMRNSVGFTPLAGTNPEIKAEMVLASILQWVRRTL